MNWAPSEKHAHTCPYPGFREIYFLWMVRFVMPKSIVRRNAFILTWVVSFLLAIGAVAESFTLNNGQTLEGELLASSANDAGVQIKVGDGKYERVPWSGFSQEDLKKFRENRKLEPLVEPFIEITIEEKVQKTEVPIKQPERLELPPKQSLIGAMLGSALGICLLLMVYAANLYAGYEIALFRAQPIGLVLGVSAILPIIGPIIYLSKGTRMRKRDEEQEEEEAPSDKPSGAAAPAAGAVGSAPTGSHAARSASPADGSLNPMQDESAEHPSSLHIAHDEPSKPTVPQTQVFQRGQFTFNRRFIETKFSGFFGLVRRDADKDMHLVVKTMRGTYVATRISRISGSDMHLEIHEGPASQEVTVNFQEIQEIQIKHKNAK